MPTPPLLPRRLSRPTTDLLPRGMTSPVCAPAPGAASEAAPPWPYCLAQRSRTHLPGPDLNALLARQHQLYDELMASGELPRPTTRLRIYAASAADLTRELAGWTPPPGSWYQRRLPPTTDRPETYSPLV